ncbi:MAG: hypothetical protein IKP47_06040 [Ruminococcus sp.]|nr:hypothetical protein [Ruminococcus sp.]
MKKNNGHRRAADIITAAVFAVFLSVFAVMLIVSKDRDFSEMENRTLAQKPEVSFENIKSGKFTDDLEKYISDQLFAKDQLVSLKTDFDRLLGKSYQNGVYIIKDEGTGDLRFVQQYTENKAQIDENIGYLKEFAQSIDIPADLILVPNASAFMKDRLPTAAVCDDQLGSIEYIRGLVGDSLGFYPMTDALSEKPEQNYYRTDHHWNRTGAMRAVTEYFSKSGQAVPEYTDNVSTLRGSFFGTLYSKAPSAFTEADDLTYGDPEIESIEWVSEGKTADSIIDRSFLDKKDKYAALLGGNFSQIRIKTGHGGEKVLILKDSYANAAMEFLCAGYSEITMIDLRYYHMQEYTVAELCEQYGADRVIMLYNMDFINEDKNFVWLT